MVSPLSAYAVLSAGTDVTPWLEYPSIRNRDPEAVSGYRAVTSLKMSYTWRMAGTLYVFRLVGTICLYIPFWQSGPDSVAWFYANISGYVLFVVFVLFLGFLVWFCFVFGSCFSVGF